MERKRGFPCIRQQPFTHTTGGDFPHAPTPHHLHISSNSSATRQRVLFFVCAVAIYVFPSRVRASLSKLVRFATSFDRDFCREDPEEASNRSREGCYAIHMWDTTWAPMQRTARRGYVWGDAYLAGVGYFAPKQRGYCLENGCTSELATGRGTGSWSTEPAISRHSSAQLGSDVCLSAGELIKRFYSSRLVNTPFNCLHSQHSTPWDERALGVSLESRGP